MDDTNAKDPVAEAVERIRKEAYAAGYQAAVAAMTSALGDLATTAPETAGNIYSLAMKSVAGGPTVGTIPHYVWMAVSKKPGMTNSELISVVKENAPKASEAVIRTSIGRLKRKNKLIVSRHGKWFPA